MSISGAYPEQVNQYSPNHTLRQLPMEIGVLRKTAMKKKKKEEIYRSSHWEGRGGGGGGGGGAKGCRGLIVMLPHLAQFCLYVEMLSLLPCTKETDTVRVGR